MEFLERGLTRNAAGKAFQAWKAFMAVLLRLELDKLKALARSEEERRWHESKAVPRVPTGKMVSLSLMLERAGHEGVIAWTAVALDLYDYQYNGPDPDMALSKFKSTEEAREYVSRLVNEVARRAEALRDRFKRLDELDKTLAELRSALKL